METETGAQLRRNRIRLRPRSSSNPTNKSSSDIPQGRMTTSEVQMSPGAEAQAPASVDKSLRSGTKNCSMKTRSGRKVRAQERLDL